MNTLIPFFCKYCNDSKDKLRKRGFQFQTLLEKIRCDITNSRFMIREIENDRFHHAFILKI